MLEVKNLHQKYHEKTVLHDVSFSQPQGTVTAIIGPSGSGKTTLLRTLNALVQPEKGQISIGDATVDFEHKSKQDIKHLRNQSAMVFQNYNLFSNKTALENITEGLIYGQKYSKADARRSLMICLMKSTYVSMHTIIRFNFLVGKVSVLVLYVHSHLIQSYFY